MTLNKIKSILLKNTKEKEIDIPTEKELYNLISNVYILRVAQLQYLSPNSAINHLCEYINNIKNQLLKKIKNYKYDFTIQELIKYIDSAMFGISEKNNKISYDLIADIKLAIFDNLNIDHPRAYKTTITETLKKEHIQNYEQLIDYELKHYNFSSIGKVREKKPNSISIKDAMNYALNNNGNIDVEMETRLMHTKNGEYYAKNDKCDRLILYFDTLLKLKNEKGYITTPILDMPHKRIKVGDILQDPYIFIDTFYEKYIDNGYNRKQQFIKLIDLLNETPIYTTASDNTIDSLKDNKRTIFE